MTRWGSWFGAGLLLALMTACPPVFGADRLVEGPPVAVGQVADEDIQRKLHAVFQRIEPWRRLEVEVAHGVVELRGSTPTFALAEKAVDLAARFEGVLYVVDAINVQAEVDSRLAPAWRKVREVADQGLEYLPLAAVAFLIFGGACFLGWLATAWEWPYQRFSGRVLLQNLIRQLIRYAFVFVGLLIALEILELTALIGAFVGAAGLFGLALGFAFKDIVENYIAGFLISVRSPFTFRDWIGVNEHQGSVVRVTSRELVIMTQEGNHVRIPNAHVFKSVIYNYTRNPLRRFDIEVGIGVGEDLARVQQVGCTVLAAMKGVAADPAPSMRTQEFGDSAMQVVFSGWVDQSAADFLKVRSEAVRLLKEALDQARVDVPVPTQKVINVAHDGAADRPLEKELPRGDVFDHAERADVGRDSHLDDQIERDRRGSGEADLLAE